MYLMKVVKELKESAAHNYNHFCISPLAVKNESPLVMFSSAVTAFFYFAIDYHTWDNSTIGLVIERERLVLAPQLFWLLPWTYTKPLILSVLGFGTFLISRGAFFNVSVQM
jgi:hypothetical protein